MVELQLARTYAKAIVKLALEENSMLEWQQGLKLLQNFVAEPQLNATIKNLSISTNQIYALLCQLMPKPQLALMQNLLLELATKRRLSLVAMIVAEVEQLALAVASKIQVELATAVELQESELAAFQKYFKQKLNGEVVIKHKVDNGLIVGFKAKVGTLVLDNSWDYKLKQIIQTSAN